MSFDDDLLSLDDEINNLKSEIKNVKNINRKNTVIRNLKIFSGGVRVVYPYIIAGSIMFGTFSFFGATPHYIDTVKINSLKIIDSNGCVKYMEFKDKDNNKEENIVKKYSRWIKEEDGSYVRTVQAYILPDEYCSNVDRIFNDMDVFDEFKLKYEGYDKNYNLSDKELLKDKYIEAYIFNDSSFNSYIEESNKESLYNTIGFYIMFFMSSLILKLFRSEITGGFVYRKYIDFIKERYPLVDVNLLIDELNNKYNEYNSLIRKK